MRLQTHHFGNLDVEDGKILYFPAGLPGFPRHRRFVLLERAWERPLHWLQAVDDPHLAFAVADHRLFCRDWSLELSAGDLELLQLPASDQAQVLAILVLDPEPERTTVNLRAPLVINPERKLGTQVILGEEWPQKHLLYSAVRPAANEV